jgi:hypothetical protein
MGWGEYTTDQECDMLRIPMMEVSIQIQVLEDLFTSAFGRLPWALATAVWQAGEAPLNGERS